MGTKIRLSTDHTALKVTPSALMTHKEITLWILGYVAAPDNTWVSGNLKEEAKWQVKENPNSPWDVSGPQCGTAFFFLRKLDFFCSTGEQASIKMQFAAMSTFPGLFSTIDCSHFSIRVYAQWHVSSHDWFLYRSVQCLMTNCSVELDCKING